MVQNNWIDYPLYAGLVCSIWLMSVACLSLSSKKKFNSLGNLGLILASAGTAVLIFFIQDLWLKLERPPLRTLGETRLWYSTFVPIIGLVCYWRWKMKWLVSYSMSMGTLFLMINLLNPQTYNRALMPALRSPWFIPHVIVYLFSYALLAASCLVAIRALWMVYREYDSGNASFRSIVKTLYMADRLVMLGFGFLSLGLLFGALWAKEAWGHYWNWDPKETWAFLTWFSYLIYIHFRHWHRRKIKEALWILSSAFIVLLLCWFGINYLPAAKTSVHTYSQQP